MTYTYLYTSAADVAVYGRITVDGIPDVIARDGEAKLEKELKKRGISPDGVSPIPDQWRMGATYFICYLLAKAEYIKIRGSDITSESGGGLSIGYAQSKMAHDWLSLAIQEVEDYVSLYTTIQPRKVSLARANYEQPEWETQEKVSTTSKL